MPWPKGKPRSPETRAKIAETSTGRRHSEESKAKIGAGNSGKVRTPEMRAAVSQGRLAYLATLTPEERAAKARTLGMLGKKHSPETRAKMGESSARSWRTATDERLALANKHMRLAVVRSREVTEGTRIEETVAARLDAQELLYVRQHPIGPYFADFYIPAQNRVVEVHGCYWHSCEPCGFPDVAGRRAYDQRRLGYIRRHGYSITVLWAHDLK